MHEKVDRFGGPWTAKLEGRIEPTERAPKGDVRRPRKKIVNRLASEPDHMGQAIDRPLARREIVLCSPNRPGPDAAQKERRRYQKSAGTQPAPTFRWRRQHFHGDHR